MPRLNRRANKQYEDDLVGRSNRIIIIILTITAIGTIKYLRLECKRIGRGDPIGDSWPKRLPASRPNYRGQLDDSPDHDVDDGDDDEHQYAHDDDDGDDDDYRICGHVRQNCFIYKRFVADPSSPMKMIVGYHNLLFIQMK